MYPLELHPIIDGVLCHYGVPPPLSQIITDYAIADIFELHLEFINKLHQLILDKQLTKQTLRQKVEIKARIRQVYTDCIEEGILTKLYRKDIIERMDEALFKATAAYLLNPASDLIKLLGNQPPYPNNPISENEYLGILRRIKVLTLLYTGMCNLNEDERTWYFTINAISSLFYARCPVPTMPYDYDPNLTQITKEILAEFSYLDGDRYIFYTLLPSCPLSDSPDITHQTRRKTPKSVMFVE